MSDQHQIRYLDEKSDLLIHWHHVINQSQMKAERIVGELMQLIEIMGLTDIQEKALKGKVKQIVYDAVNSGLDWNANQLLKLDSDGKLVSPEETGFSQSTPRIS